MNIKPISFDAIAADVGPGNDLNSIVRNTDGALKGFGISVPGASVTTTVLPIFGGVGGLVVAGNMMRHGVNNAIKAHRSGDTESRNLNLVWAGAIGAPFAGISGLLGSEGVMGLTNTAVPGAMGSAFAGLGLGMNAALGVYGAYGLNEARKFGNELEKRTDQEVIDWLSAQIPAENDPTYQKKLGALELRLGSEFAKTLRDKLDDVEESLDIKKDAQLVQEVKKANFKQQVKFALFILLALVGTAAVIAMIISTGPASPIIFALGAMLWLTVDSSKLHSYIGEKLWTWHCDVKTTEPTCQKTHLISHKTIS